MFTHLFVADATAEALRLRPNGSGTPTETNARALPATFPASLGGLAARPGAGDNVDVYFLLGGSPDFGPGGAPQSFNELYKLTFTPNGDGEFGPVGSWSYVADFVDPFQGIPVPFVSPLVGLAAFQNDFFSLDLDDVYNESVGRESGRAARLASLDLGEETVTSQMSFPIASGEYSSFSATEWYPTALDGANARGSIFIAGPEQNIGGFGRADELATSAWISMFEEGIEYSGPIVYEYDPRNNYVAQVLYNSSGFPGMTAIEPLTVDGLGFSGGQLTVTGLLPGQSSRYFSRLNPDTNGYSATSTEAGAREVFGIAGVSYGTVPAAKSLSNPDDGQFDNDSIDPLFADLAYSPSAVAGNGGASNAGVVSPLAALYTLHILDTSLDPQAAANTAEIGNIPTVLVNNADTVGGIGRATFDLRDPLPPGHPLGSLAGPPLEVHFAGLDTFSPGPRAEAGVITSLGSLDLRFDPSGRAASGFQNQSDLPTGLARVGAQGGLTTRNVGGSTVHRLLYGGFQSGSADRSTDLAFNEVYEIDLSQPDPQWRPIGKFVDGADSASIDFGDGRLGDVVLTGLAGFERQDYAIGSDSRIFELAYPDSPGRVLGSRRELVNFMWDSGGALASAESRGSMFAVGAFAGEAAPVQPLFDTVIYEFDPRNSFVKDSWWGGAGDFRTTAATTWGTFGAYRSATPEHAVEIDGAAYVEGALVINGLFDFRNESTRRVSTEQASISINVNATGADNNPYLMRLDAGGAIDWVGLASSADAGGVAAPSVTLDAARGAVDTMTINGSFAGMSYSKKALRSGVIQQIFAAEFARATDSPSECQAHLLDVYSADVEKALRKFAGKKNGIGRATAFLRERLASKDMTCGCSEEPHMN